MKKISSLLIILLGLSVLINCSPKTVKKTADVSSSGNRVSGQDNQMNRDVPVEPTRTEVVQPDMNPKKTDREPVSLSTLGNEQLLALYSDVAPMRIEIGKKLYQQNCNKCHDYYIPENRYASDWVTIMRSMGPKAELSTDKHIMVAAYLVANAKK